MDDGWYTDDTYHGRYSDDVYATEQQQQQQQWGSLPRDAARLYEPAPMHAMSPTLLRLQSSMIAILIAGAGASAQKSGQLPVDRRSKVGDCVW